MGGSRIPQAIEDLFADTPPAPDFMGITLDRAEARAAAKGIDLRVVLIDPAPHGEGRIGLTMDLRTDRLNVVVKDHVVVRAGYF